MKPDADYASDFDAFDSREDYYSMMRGCGFDDHEIDECWDSPSRDKILDAALADGERDLSA